MSRSLKLHSYYIIRGRETLIENEIENSKSKALETEIKKLKN